MTGPGRDGAVGADLPSGDAERERRRSMRDAFEKSAAGRAEAEAEAVERLLGETEAVRSEIRRAAASVDWETLPTIIAERARAEKGEARKRSASPRLWGWPSLLRMKPALAGLAAGLVVGAAAMYLALRGPAVGQNRGSAYYASGDFLDRAELEMARRNTLDYLEKSQYMLLDVFESADRGGAVSAAVRSGRARDLLQKKKYLNAQLGTIRMAKAKALCDQIEMLFLELAQVDEELPAAELAKLRSYVEERQLLLKINLVRKELESGV